MAPQRSFALPKKRNPLLAPDLTPNLSDLASRRRLGATTLAVKPGQVGTSNATKPENLGVFEYAHLRAPLPDNLKSSEIFAPQPKSPHPEAYFLMRRSNDGFVSATGMFKASFPWAKHAEEQAEREYVKSLPTTGQDEVAGNVWIPEEAALSLAEEYGITAWVVALLDPTPVQTVNTGAEDRVISSPPKFEFKAGDKLSLPPPISTPGRGRGRPRGGSPAKTPGSKLTSPRKRTTKAVKEASAAAARQASDSLQAALDSAASVTESITESERTEDRKADDDKVIVNVKTDVEVSGDIETTHTNVEVKMPAGSPQLPLPESTEEMVAKAKQMVEEAVKLEGADSSKKSGKRKAEILDADDDEAADGKIVHTSKKPKIFEQEVKRQKVRNRALVGVAATLALGAIVPYVLGA